MKNQVRSYLKEAKWFHQKYTPTVVEYMHIAIVSAGYPALAITSLVGMGDIVTKDSFEWLFNRPKVVTASSLIARLMDDMMSHKVLFYFYTQLLYFQNSLI
jgi:(-)-germacrene D synthase